MNILRMAAKKAMQGIDPYILIGKAPPQSPWDYITAHFKKFSGVVFVCLIITAIVAGGEVFLLSYIGRLIDALTETPADQIWSQHSMELIWASIFVLAIRPALAFLKNLAVFFSFQCNSTNLFRWNAFDHISKQPIGWFQEDLSGRVANRLLNIGNHATEIIYRAIDSIVFAVVYLGGIIIFLSSTSSSFALPLLIWLVLYVALVAYAIPRSIKTNHAFQASRSAVMGSLVDNLSNFETVALNSTRKNLTDDYMSGLEYIRSTLFESKMVQLVLKTSLILLEGVMIFGFLAYGIWLWAAGQVSVGIVGVSLALCLRMSSLAEHVFYSIWTISERIGSLKEALDTVSQPLKIEDAPEAKALVVDGGGIELTNVSHYYGLGHGYGGLNDISLSISPGEKIAIVGRSGAGKSTLINLIARSFEAESGDICIDGQSIRNVTQESLRDSIAIVSQQAGLLNRSVLHNITLGKDIPIEQVQKAARDAKAHDFIMKLKDNKGRTGYDAFVGERGVTLSGGQRQRLAITRALLKDAKILVLDEATSALDSEVESEIQTALKTAMENKTVIAIAHRLSTITQMDRIVVFDHGRIIEQGAHGELLKTKGQYSRLWSLQTEGFEIYEDEALVAT